MQYDPIKKSLGHVFNRSVFLRKLFYRLLDLLLLRAWHIRKLMKSYSKIYKPEKILDAGSGFGQYTYRMSRLFPNAEILALDLKQEQVDDCNRFFKEIGNNKVRFETADLIQLNKADEFELVLCVDVMEHIEEDEKVFSNLYKAMKPGGWLLISTPSDRGGSDVKHEGESSFIEEHVRDGYNAGDIENKLRKAGFSHVEVNYSYGTPGKISWRLSMKYPILMIGKSKLYFILLPFWYLFSFPVCYFLNHFDVIIKHPTGTGLIVKAVK